MKKMFFFCLLVSSVSIFGGDNLVRNCDFNAPLDGEFRLLGPPNHLKLTVFTEDSTWNKCARLEVVNFIEKDGVKEVNGSLTIGGDKENFGFPVKPDTTYSFSLEIKGSAQRIFCGALGWESGKKYWDPNKLKGGIGLIKVNKDWTRYQGTFRTDSKTSLAALKIQFWGNSKNNQLLENIGDYVLVDNVFISEVPEDERNDVKNINSAKIAIPGILSDIPILKNAPAENDWAKAPSIQGFSSIMTQAPVDNDTSAKVLCDDKNIYLKIFCTDKEKDKILAKQTTTGSGELWKDDLVEIFFAPLSDDRLFSQFAVSAGNGRWMGHGKPLSVDNYSAWTASSVITDKGWECLVCIPLSLLGKDGALKAGDSLKFNIGRQRTANKEISSWAKIRNSFGDCERFGILVFGPFAEYSKIQALSLKKELKDFPESKEKENITKEITELEKNSSEANDSYLLLAGIKAKMKALRFAGLCFTVGKIHPTDTPSIPLNLAQPDIGKNSIKLSGAVNERFPLPLIIGNKTDKTAEYRVTLITSDKTVSGINKNGLEGFPDNQIEFRRGVIVKDDDSPNHGLRFDPLPKMDEAQTVSVAAGENGMVWINFDSKGVKPGVYKGLLRIIPLSEPIEYNKKSRTYEGPIRDIPVELEILPIILSENSEIPLWLMGHAANDDFFNYLNSVGGSMAVHINPWWMKVKFGKDGSILEKDFKHAEEVIIRHLDWLKKNNVKKGLCFDLAFSAYKIFEDAYLKPAGIKYGTPEWANAWKNWLGEFAGLMKKHGLTYKDYAVEAWDEPQLNDYEKVLAVCKLTKEFNPEIQIQVTFAAFSFAPGLKEVYPLIDYCDIWAIWDNHFSNPEYLKFSRDLADKGKKIWNYRCNTSMRESLYRYYRLLPWMGWTYGHEANGLFYFIDGPDGSYGGQNWKRACWGGMVYSTGDKCIPSIRYECLKLGDTDLKYLALLKRIIEGTKESAENKNLLSDARKFLSESGRKVLLDNPHNEKYADNARETAKAYILKLQNSK